MKMSRSFQSSLLKTQSADRSSSSNTDTTTAIITKISTKEKEKHSPTRQFSTPSPNPTTTPALSCPSPNSPSTFDDPIPPSFQKCTSLPQIPVARTWIRHSLGPGVGVGTARRWSSWEGVVVMARFCLRADMLLFSVVMGKGRFWIVVEEGWMLDRCVCSKSLCRMKGFSREESM